MTCSDRKSTMDPNVYQELASVTESRDFEAIRSRISTVAMIRLLHAMLGLSSEVGEFSGALKKHLFYGAPLDTVNLSEETGDLLWYIALAANVNGVSLASIMQKNIDKLRARYGDKFSEYLAEHRNLLIEREILEGNTL